MMYKKSIKILSAVTLFSFTLSVVLLPSIPARAEEMFQMEESEAPPKGVSQMADDIRKTEEAEARQSETFNAPATAAPAVSGTTGKKGEDKSEGKTNYHGVFDLLTPLNSVLPIKSGNIKTSLISTANNTGNSSSYLLRQNMSGGYFFETEEQDFWKFTKVTMKTQYNRQLRNTLTANSMNEVSMSAFGSDFKYNRAVSRTGSGGSQNVSDTRKFSANYQNKNGLTLSYNIDQNISKAISTSPSKTNNKKQTWNLVVPLNITDGAKLTLTNADTANRNLTGGSATKVRQSDVRLDLPVSKKYELNLGYQFLGSRNQAAASSENRKSTRYIGMSYKFLPDTKLTYLYNFSNSRNFSTLDTQFNTVNRDLQFESAMSKSAKLKMGYTNTFDQSAGRTTIRTGNFALDHKKLHLLPGTTTIDTRKQFTGAAGNSNTNFTLSLNTPLSYMKGKLTTNYSNVYSVSNALTNSQRDRSINRTFTVDYKTSQRLVVGTSFNRIKSGRATPTTSSNLAVNHLRTDRVSYDFGKDLNFWKGIDGVKYSYTMTRNNMRNEVPTPGLTYNRVRSHSIDMVLKGNKWSGGYGFGRSLSSSLSSGRQRILQHKLGLTFEDIMGCKFSMNYLGAFQKSGSQISMIYKLTKKVSDKTSFFASYESLENTNRDPGGVDTRNRYMDVGVDLNF